MIFHYQKKNDPDDEVIHIVENMFKYSVQEAIRGKFLLDHLDENRLKNILKEMTLENCRVQLITKMIENETNK